MKPVAFCSLMLGLLQLAAITLGLSAWLDIHWSVTLLMALPLVSLPVIGPLAAMLGAMQAWQWPLAKAALVFLPPLLVIMIASGELKLSRLNFRRLRGKRPATIDL